jgi:hypothetical protein
LKRAVDETMSRKREWNRYQIPVFGLDRMAFLTQPLPAEIQSALNPDKVVVLSSPTSLPVGQRERFLCHVLRSFGDYSVLLILEDSIYRKDKGARNASWRLAGTLTTWVREKAPRQILQVPVKTRREEEFAAAEPATSHLSEIALAMKSVAGDRSAAWPHAKPRDRTSELGSEAWDATPYRSTHPQGGNGRNRVEQGGTSESHV